MYTSYDCPPTPHPYIIPPALIYNNARFYDFDKDNRNLFKRKVCCNAEEHLKEKKAPVQGQKFSSVLKVPLIKSCHSDWKHTQISQTIHESPQLHLITILYWDSDTCLSSTLLNSTSLLDFEFLILLYLLVAFLSVPLKEASLILSVPLIIPLHLFL